MQVAKIILLGVCFFCLNSYGYAQKFSLEVHLPEGYKTEKLFPSLKTQHRDSLQVRKEINLLLLQLHNASFLNASIDSVTRQGNIFHAYFTPGESYKWVALRKGNLDPQLLSQANYKEKFYRNKPFQYSELAALEENILITCENQGYPFALVRLDSVQIKDKQFSATLYWEKGPFITFDTLVILGTTKIKNKFLASHLRIIEGQPYNQARVNSISRMLKELPYIREQRPPVIEFREDKAVVILFLEDRRVNQVDGVAGFLPNQNGQKKMLITGELNLALKNLFGSGKSLDAEWKRYDQQSQTLDIAYRHPKLFRSNIDLGFQFDLLKQDTSFLNVYRRIDFNYRAGVKSKAKIFAGYKTSAGLAALANNDSTKLLYGDFRYLSYGLGYEINTQDDLFYPHRGGNIDMNVYLGNKYIDKNPNVPTELYNGVKLTSVQFNSEVKVEYFFPLGKRSVLANRISAAKIFNEQQNIFFNDLYRLGGLTTLRGFNEKFFYASAYVTGSIEYRFFTDETSYLLIFTDMGAMENVLNETRPYDYPFGVGAGVSFTTRAGVFTFVYALGKSNDQTLAFNQSKVHFGLISRF